MKEVISLVFKSNCSDFKGTYNKSEMESEMSDILGTIPEDDSWIDWTLNHVLDCSTDIPQDVIDMFKRDNVTSIGLVIEGFNVTIEKKYS